MDSSLKSIPLRGLAVLILAMVSISTADVAHGQWLDPTLDNQRWNNLRKHQQRQREKSLKRRSQPDARVSGNPCTLDSVPAADRRRMEVEYERRLRADGRARAEAWVLEQGRAWRERPAARGRC